MLSFVVAFKLLDSTGQGVLTEASVKYVVLSALRCGPPLMVPLQPGCRRCHSHSNATEA
jgi:hypothetical protein